jgi:hypothetical protein
MKYKEDCQFMQAKQVVAGDYPVPGVAAAVRIEVFAAATPLEALAHRREAAQTPVSGEGRMGE